MFLGQGPTAGVIDQGARAVAVAGTFFLPRTKAVLMSYLTGVLKNQIPPYCSYYRNPEECTPTVQQVIGFLVDAVKKKGEADFWMALQETMDTFEQLVLARRVPQYLMWPELATSEQRDTMRAEMFEYFELDEGNAVERRVRDLFGGLDLDKIGTWLMWGGVLVAAVLILPPLFTSIQKPK